MSRATVVPAVAVIVAVCGVCFGTTAVTELVTGSPGDWTHTYALTNDEARPIWYWAVWFPSDPSADAMTCDPNWTATIDVMGYYPEEYKSDWGDVQVYDAWPGSTDLVGPNGEKGFFGAAASDMESSNSGEYWDGDAWQPLPDPPDPNKIWRGDWYGWTGAGANIQTANGVGVGSSAQFTVHSTSQSPDLSPKSFSFSTTDHWLWLLDDGGPSDTGDDEEFFNFEASGTVTLIPEPLTLLGVFLGVGSLGGYVRRRRKL